MAQPINMTLSLTEHCGLTASYNSDTTNEQLETILDPCSEDASSFDFTNKAIVDFLTDCNGEIVSSSLHVHAVTSNSDLEIYNSTEISIPKDGYYTFYRLYIPMFASLNGYTANKYFGLVKDGVCNIYTTSENTVSDTSITKSNIVINPLLIWDKKDTQVSYYYTASLFSLCKINNCLIKLQKKLLNNNNCDFTCKDPDSSKRNFLLTTVHILEYLSNQGRYYDAQDIIDSVFECGGLCEDNYNSVNNCNCGKD